MFMAVFIDFGEAVAPPVSVPVVCTGCRGGCTEFDCWVFADELVRHKHPIRRHVAVVDAVFLTALDANLIACREVAKHFECPYGTGASITPDGVIVMADGTVLALDVVVVGTGDKAQETARRKRFGWGSLGALERAKRARARGLRVYKEMVPLCDT